MESHQQMGLPTQSHRFWVILWLLFGSVLVVTMVKDWWLTTEEPNMLFYLFVPLLSIVGSVVSMYGVAKMRRHPIPFATLLAISLGTNILMQVVENLIKIIYYLIWEYPGILYLVFVVPLGFLLLVSGLVRWGNVKMWMAVMLAGCGVVGEMVISIVLTNGFGLTTPGS